MMQSLPSNKNVLHVYSKAPREIHIYYKLIDKKSSAEQIAAWGANGNEKV